MSLVAIDGFDMYAGIVSLTGLQAKWALNTTTAFAMVTGRFGGQAMQISPTGGETSALRTFPAAVGDAAVGFAMRWTTLPDAVRPIGMLVFMSSGTAHVGWRVTPTGTIEALRFASKISVTSLGVTPAQVLFAGAWHFVETEVVISDTVGRVTIWVDGVQVLNLTGQDTRNGAPTTTDSVLLGFSGVGGSSGGIQAIDDYYQANTAARIGEGFVETLRPASDSAVTFTPNSGANNYSRVNETTVDGDTTYNQGTTVGNADLFGLASLATAPATVYGVQLVDFMRKTDAATRTAYQEIKSGSTTDDGSAVGLSASYGRFERLLVNDPNTGAAWAYTAVNAALKGYKIAS